MNKLANLFLIFALVCVVAAQDDVDEEQFVEQLPELFVSIPIQCGATSNRKEIEMTSPTTISATECVYTIRPTNLRICQLRLDFTFAIDAPTTNNDGDLECTVGFFSVKYLDTFEFKVCGSNFNQHIYVPFNVTKVTDEAFITIKASGKPAFWSILATQLECPVGSPRQMEARAVNDGFQIAPNGCLQYYPEPNGTVESFNHNYRNGPYMSSMDYSICFRRTSATKGIELTTRFFAVNSGLEASTDAPGVTVDPDSDDEFDCENGDYLFVPFGIYKEKRNTMFCGNGLAEDSIITADQLGPYMIAFHSDDNYDAGVDVGFSFSYKLL